MIKTPPDGREVVGQRIEGQVHGLDQLVTDYLNMLSIADRAAGEQKVRDAIRAYPVLARVLHFSPLKKEHHNVP